MLSKERKHSKNKINTKQRLTKPTIENPDLMTQQQIHPTTTMRGAKSDPSSLTASNALQLQRTKGNQAVGQLLARTAQNHPIQDDVVQRKNGARVEEWHTTSITAREGFIIHDVGWKSSTGNLGDLEHVWTREEVTWDGCPWAEDEYYRKAGKHHGLGDITVPGTQGQNRDTHQAAQPLFNPNNPPLKPGETMTFEMKQVYQYSTDKGTTWHDIPGSEYALTRTLYRRRWPFRNQYVYTLTKQGVKDAKVKHTTSVKFQHKAVG